jgi:serine/threonine protein kinase
MIGTKLAHYEITSHLGTGGMGEVYQAADTKLGRNVASNYCLKPSPTIPTALDDLTAARWQLARLRH